MEWEEQQDENCTVIIFPRLSQYPSQKPSALATIKYVHTTVENKVREGFAGQNINLSSLS
jgi:hypothetical protein